MKMNVDGLTATRDLIEERYNQLANSQWVSHELSKLKGQYDILSELIKEQQNAESEPQQKKRRLKRNDNKRK